MIVRDFRPWHHEVEQDDRRPYLSEQRQRFDTIAGRLHLVAFRLEQHGQHLAEVRVIFDNQYTCHV